MNAPDSPPVVIDGGDRTCVALLTELRDHITRLALDPLDALGHMLRALGCDPAAIPGQVDEAAARFRPLAAGRRLLILLDNAGSAQQVRPLLPAGPGSAVLITSRRPLVTLGGAYALHLEVLSEQHALELLGEMAGPERIAAEQKVAAAVTRWCGRLPLAIRIAGARLAARPSWPVAALANLLADVSRRLETLESLASGEVAVRWSFGVSLHALPLCDCTGGTSQQGITPSGIGWRRSHA